MCSNPEELKFAFCDYTSTRSYNVKRHIVIKHSPQIAIPCNETAMKHCEQCDKTFTTHWSLSRHTKTCDGITSKKCEYCHKCFSHRNYKYKHIRTCKVKAELNEMVLS